MQKKLIIICVIGLLLRLMGLYNIRLGGDFAYHWQVAGSIVRQGYRPLVGPSASENTAFHLGPFYYYLLAVPYFLGNGNYQVAIIFFSILNSFSIFALYYVCKEWFSPQISLKITALYAFSAYMITIQNFPWNPYILPLLIILSLYCLTQIQKKKYFFLLPLSLLIGLTLQAHATAVFLLPVFVFALPLRTIPIKLYLVSGFLFLLTLSPWLMSGFAAQSQAAMSILSPVQKENCSLVYYLAHHGNGERCFAQIRNSLFIGRLFSKSLLNTQNLILVALILFTFVLFLIKGRFEQKRLFRLWFFVPWFFFLFYSSNIYLHYLLILVPLPFVLEVLLMEKLGRFKNPIFVSIILLNLVGYFISLQTIR